MRHTVFGYQRPWYVSIHASVKDATAAILNNRRFDLVSIHASVKDATLKFRLILSALMFQSTHL